MVDLLNIQGKVLETIKQAWIMAMQYFDEIEKLEVHIKSSSKDMKTDWSPVTDADTQLELFLKEELLKILPWSWFYGEETGRHEWSIWYRWIIDPIDGTRDFARWLPDRSILCALEYKGDIILWVSYMPVIDEMMHASSGNWSRCNWKRLQVSSRELGKAYITFERHQYFIRDDTHQQLLKLCEHVDYYKGARIRWYHFLAKWGIDACIAPKQYIYELSPFLIIIPEAGGKITNIQGWEVTEDFTDAIFSNGVCHDDIINIFNT